MRNNDHEFLERPAIASTQFISQLMNSYEDYTTSAIFTLALLDLVPLQVDLNRQELYDRKHNSGRGVIINPKINMLVYVKEVKEVEADLKDNIMVIH